MTLTADARRDPDATRSRILSALEAAGGNRTHARRALGATATTWHMAIALLGLAPVLSERWPERVRGGGIQSDAHRAEVAARGRGLSAARWAAVRAAEAKNSGKRRHSEKSTGP